MRTHDVRCLLMGGQACVLYGAAEFSRDTDLAILASPENLDRLRGALAELDAECIAVPPFDAAFLGRGHAVHFRCRREEVRGMRVDVMSVMRGVGPFDELWPRRTTIRVAETELFELLGLRDLVQAKKTQRDKDWPMVRRLVEVNYFTHRDAASQDHLAFWLAELRTPALLVEISRIYSELAREAAVRRPLVRHAIAGDEGAVESALWEEERRERHADQEYWRPLRQELERLRHGG